MVDSIAGGLPVEEVARYPVPGTAVPGNVAFSPSGEWIAWLHSSDRTLTRELFVHHVESGRLSKLDPPGRGVDEAELSLAERLRRERQRELGEGIASFSWADDADVLIVPVPGGVWLLEPEGEWRQVVEGEAIDPRLSPDGSKIAFVRDGEVHVVAADPVGDEACVTSGAGDGVTNGLAEFIAQEEMGREHGFFWSPDGRRIAFCQVDERGVAEFRIPHFGDDDPAADELHRYPFAGAPNAIVDLGVVDADADSSVGGTAPEVTWLDLGDTEYLARVHWSGNDAVVAEVENRAQNRLELIRFDLATGDRSVLLVEESDVWINIHDAFRALRDGRFIWASERTGYRHLELRESGGSLVRSLTAGDWLVDSVVAVDEDRGSVWFTATADGAVERHLYEVAFEGGPPRRLTVDAGTHSVTAHSGTRLFVDSWSSIDTPPRVVLRSLDTGEVVRTLFDEPDPRVEKLDLRPPELRTVTTRDGILLHAALFRPDGDGPFPLVVSVYGGPHAQRVTHSWTTTANMRAQMMRSLGCAVLVLDNRGSAGRGLAFEAPLKHRMGSIEVQDQVDGVRALVDEGLADADRVGIYGWSYGGYMAAMCLARAPEVFRCAVAGAPVTSWDGYDTHYTERYMGLPDGNGDGYEDAAVMTHVDGMRGALLLVHGLLDENVHFRHTARLINALIRARKPYELLLYPEERHVPRSEKDRVHMEERIRDFLATQLG